MNRKHSDKKNKQQALFPTKDKIAFLRDQCIHEFDEILEDYPRFKRRYEKGIPKTDQKYALRWVYPLINLYNSDIKNLNERNFSKIWSPNEWHHRSPGWIAFQVELLCRIFESRQKEKWSEEKYTEKIRSLERFWHGRRYDPAKNMIEIFKQYSQITNIVGSKGSGPLETALYITGQFYRCSGRTIKNHLISHGVWTKGKTTNSQVALLARYAQNQPFSIWQVEQRLIENLKHK